MATQPDPESAPTKRRRGGGGIGPGTLATAGLALIALAILIWFLYPRMSGPGEPTAKTPATVIAELVTVTPRPATATAAPTEVAQEAPTPAPVVPSATAVPPTATLPARVQVGVYAKVAGTGSLGLRYRSGPGEDFVTWRILPEGEILQLTGGPEEVNGIVWWRALDRTGLVGWAAEQYLVPVEPPAWTPEPERTPDLAERRP